MSDVGLSFDTLEQSLDEASKCLQVATLSLRSAFSVNASSVKEFVDLRNSLVDDALAYKSQVLPVATQSSEIVKQSMDYFVELTMDDVLSIIDDLLEDAKTNTELMEVCQDMHVVMSTKFKQKEDKVDNTLAACEMEKKKYEQEMQALADKANTKQNWAVALAFVPVVGLVASPLLVDASKKDRCAALAASEEAQLAVNASYVVRNVLVPSINGYAEAMRTCAGTFTLICTEMKQFTSNLEKLGKSEKEAFFKVCKAKAKKVSTACERYLTVAKDAEANLAALPTSLNEPNYVKTWLAKQASADGKSFLSRLRAIASLPDGIKALTNGSEDV